MLKNSSLLDLMLVCVAPIYTIDDAQKYVQAVVEISNRRNSMVSEDYGITERFLNYCEMYHNTKNNIYLRKALHLISWYAEVREE